MENSNFSIVLPAHNESENLPDVLRGLKKALDKADIQAEMIVINDGSTDNTEEVLESLKKEIAELKTLRIEKSLGYGNAIIKGLELAQAPILSFMVTDGQITAEALVDVYRKLKNDNLDICKGFRINRRDGRARAIISKVYNFIFRLMFDCPLKDIDGGPKVFTRHLYETVKPQSKDFFIDAEILIKARRSNFPIGEFPVPSLERTRGRSTVSALAIFKLCRSMLYWFLFK